VSVQPWQPLPQPWQQQSAPDARQLRAGHADRERAIDVLKAAFAEGRLDQDEFTERVEKVQRSRTYGDLAEITADLPVGPLGGLPLSPGPAPAQFRPAEAPVQPAPASPPDTRHSGGVSGLAVLALCCGIVAVISPSWQLALVPAILWGLRSLTHRANGSGLGRAIAFTALLLGVVALWHVGSSLG
jgi:Domain of unknown function (DUF1707)